MPMINSTLTLPQPTLTSTASTKAAAPAPAAAPATPAAATRAPDPSTTVTLSPQALSALASANHPAPAPSSTAGSAPPAPAAVAQDDSVYESLKHGIAAAVTDVGDAIAGGAHAVVDGVETTLSTANKVAKGILELPFAALAKASDAAGALIDEL